MKITYTSVHLPLLEFNAAVFADENDNLAYWGEAAE